MDDGHYREQKLASGPQTSSVDHKAAEDRAGLAV